MTHAQPKAGALRLALLGVIGTSLIVITGAGSFAGLNATDTGTHVSTSGNLSLSVTNNGTGFTQSVSNMAPGDTVNRYVTLTNDGSLSSKNLSLKITPTGTATLITNGSGAATNKAITVAVNSCSGSWNTTTGACTGSISNEIAATPLSTFATAQNFLVTTALAAAGTSKLQIQVVLPDQNETTVDGALPAVTVQSGSVTMDYLFFEAQRTTTVTHS